jgi:hypothetical protein
MHCLLQLLLPCILQGSEPNLPCLGDASVSVPLHVVCLGSVCQLFHWSWVDHLVLMPHQLS